MYAWAEKASYDTASREASVVSHHTIHDMYQRCREVVGSVFLQHQEQRGQIGGPGIIVQIDESKFGRRKYERGRVIEGHWVIGMIADGSQDLRLEICPENSRTRETLWPLIQRHVATGSIIRTDGWPPYQGLGSLGYVHQWVNHSVECVSAEGVHTQRIEASWRPVKNFFRDRQVPEEDIADHVVEYQWRRWCRHNGVHPFESLLNAIREAFPV